MPIFAKFEGGKTKIRTDVKKGAHTDWLTLESAQFTATRPSGSAFGSGSEGGRASMSEVFCTTLVQDAASDIFGASAQGTVFTLVTIDFAKSSEDKPYFQIKMKSAIVSSVSISGGPNSAASFAFNYNSVEYAVNSPPEGKSATLMQFDLDAAKAR